jgi:hypothetical protein
MKIRVEDYTGRYAITLEDGQTVLEQLRPALQNQETVELDFANVDIFASPFFNAAIGQLVRYFDSETLNNRLQVRNLSMDGNALLRRVIENAKQYYSDDIDRMRIDEVVTEQVSAD